MKFLILMISLFNDALLIGSKIARWSLETCLLQIKRWRLGVTKAQLDPAKMSEIWTRSPRTTFAWLLQRCRLNNRSWGDINNEML